MPGIQRFSLNFEITSINEKVRAELKTALLDFL